jgi:hypothetical protein
MENQTRFDLNLAVKNWQSDLAAQPNFAAEDRCELEAHLRDTIAGLQQRGLNDEESFWLARHRVGQLQPLDDEFKKSDPARFWNERIFWMATSLVGSYVFMIWKDLLASWLNQSNWLECFYLIPLFALIGSVVIIRRGLTPKYLENISSWKLACGLFVILTITILAAYFRGRNLPGNDLITAGYNIGMVWSWLGNGVWPTAMVLILFLTLKRNRKALHRL